MTFKIWHPTFFSRISFNSFLSNCFPQISSLSKDTRPSFSFVFSVSSIYFSEFNWFFSQLFFAEIVSFPYFIFNTIFFSFLWFSSDKSLGHYTLIFCTLLHQPICLWPSFLVSSKRKIWSAGNEKEPPRYSIFSPFQESHCILSSAGIFQQYRPSVEIQGHLFLCIFCIFHLFFRVSLVLFSAVLLHK